MQVQQVQLHAVDQGGEDPERDSICYFKIQSSQMLQNILKLEIQMVAKRLNLIEYPARISL